MPLPLVASGVTVGGQIHSSAKLLNWPDGEEDLFLFLFLFLSKPRVNELTSYRCGKEGYKLHPALQEDGISLTNSPVLRYNQGIVIIPEDIGVSQE